MYIPWRESLPVSLRVLGEQGEAFKWWAISRSGRLQITVLTSWYTEDLEDTPTEVSGVARKTGKKKKRPKANWCCAQAVSRNAGIRAMYTTSVQWTYHGESHSQHPCEFQASGARPSSCEPLAIQKCFRRHRTHLLICWRPWECAHGQWGRQGIGRER